MPEHHPRRRVQMNLRILTPPAVCLRNFKGRGCLHGGGSAQSEPRLIWIERRTRDAMEDCAEGHLRIRGTKMMKGHAKGHRLARGPCPSITTRLTHVAYSFVGHKNICKSQKTVITNM
jgi:hypothetical protein